MGWGASPVATLAQGLGSGGGTSSAIDTTGADTLFLLVGLAGGAPTTLTDSKANTWTLILSTTDGSGHFGLLYYAKNAAAGTGHTFTVQRSSSPIGIAVAAFTGGDLTAPLDQSSSASNNFQTTITAGSITPTAAGELVIASIANSDVQSLSTIGESYTIGPNLTGVSGANFGAAIAYKIQGSAVATNPTFTESGSTLSNHAILASFKAASGSGPVTYNITVSCTQSQAVNLQKQINVIRSVTQGQSVSLGKLIQLTRSIAQSQVVSLQKLVRLTRIVTQSQSVALTTLRVILLTVSATQSQLVSLTTTVIPFTGVINQIRLRLFGPHDSDPGSWIDL